MPNYYRDGDVLVPDDGSDPVPWNSLDPIQQARFESASQQAEAESRNVIDASQDPTTLILPKQDAGDVMRDYLNHPSKIIVDWRGTVQTVQAAMVGARYEEGQELSERDKQTVLNYMAGHAPKTMGGTAVDVAASSIGFALGVGVMNSAIRGGAKGALAAGAERAATAAAEEAAAAATRAGAATVAGAAESAAGAASRTAARTVAARAADASVAFGEAVGAVGEVVASAPGAAAVGNTGLKTVWAASDSVVEHAGYKFGARYLAGLYKNPGGIKTKAMLEILAGDSGEALVRNGRAWYMTRLAQPKLAEAAAGGAAADVAALAENAVAQGLAKTATLQAAKTYAQKGLLTGAIAPILDPRMTIENTADSAMGQFGIREDEHGTVHMTLDKEGKNIIQALGEGFLKTGIEYWSEMTGDNVVLAKAIYGPSFQRMLAKSVMIRRLEQASEFLAKKGLPVAKAKELAGEYLIGDVNRPGILRRLGISNVLGEMGEEVVGSAARQLLGLQEFGVAGFEDAIGMMLGFAVNPLAIGAFAHSEALNHVAKARAKFDPTIIRYEQGKRGALGLEEDAQGVKDAIQTLHDYYGRTRDPKAPVHKQVFDWAADRLWRDGLQRATEEHFVKRLGEDSGVKLSVYDRIIETSAQLRPGKLTPEEMDGLFSMLTFSKAMRTEGDRELAEKAADRGYTEQAGPDNTLINDPQFKIQRTLATRDEGMVLAPKFVITPGRVSSEEFEYLVKSYGAFMQVHDAEELATDKVQIFGVKAFGAGRPLELSDRDALNLLVGNPGPWGSTSVLRDGRVYVQPHFVSRNTLLQQSADRVKKLNQVAAVSPLAHKYVLTTSMAQRRTTVDPATGAETHDYEILGAYHSPGQQATYLAQGWGESDLAEELFHQLFPKSENLGPSMRKAIENMKLAMAKAHADGTNLHGFEGLPDTELIAKLFSVERMRQSPRRESSLQNVISDLDMHANDGIDAEVGRALRDKGFQGDPFNFLMGEGSKYRSRFHPGSDATDGDDGIEPDGGGEVDTSGLPVLPLTEPNVIEAAGIEPSPGAQAIVDAARAEGERMALAAAFEAMAQREQAAEVSPVPPPSAEEPAAAPTGAPKRGRRKAAKVVEEALKGEKPKRKRKTKKPAEVAAAQPKPKEPDPIVTLDVNPPGGTAVPAASLDAEMPQEPVKEDGPVDSTLDENERRAAAAWAAQFTADDGIDIGRGAPSAMIMPTDPAAAPDLPRGQASAMSVEKMIEQYKELGGFEARALNGAPMRVIWDKERNRWFSEVDGVKAPMNAMYLEMYIERRVIGDEPIGLTTAGIIQPLPAPPAPPVPTEAVAQPGDPDVLPDLDEEERRESVVDPSELSATRLDTADDAKDELLRTYITMGEVNARRIEGMPIPGMAKGYGWRYLMLRAGDPADMKAAFAESKVLTKIHAMVQHAESTSAHARRTMTALMRGLKEQIMPSAAAQSEKDQNTHGPIVQYLVDDDGKVTKVMSSLDKANPYARTFSNVDGDRTPIAQMWNFIGHFLQTGGHEWRRVEGVRFDETPDESGMRKEKPKGQTRWTVTKGLPERLYSAINGFEWENGKETGQWWVQLQRFGDKEHFYQVRMVRPRPGTKDMDKIVKAYKAFWNRQSPESQAWHRSPEDMAELAKTYEGRAVAEMQRAVLMDELVGPYSVFNKGSDQKTLANLYKRMEKLMTPGWRVDQPHRIVVFNDDIHLPVKQADGTVAYVLKPKSFDGAGVAQLSLLQRLSAGMPWSPSSQANILKMFYSFRSRLPGDKERGLWQLKAQIEAVDERAAREADQPGLWTHLQSVAQDLDAVLISKSSAKAMGLTGWRVAELFDDHGGPIQVTAADVDVYEFDPSKGDTANMDPTDSNDERQDNPRSSRMPKQVKMMRLLVRRAVLLKMLRNERGYLNRQLRRLKDFNIMGTRPDGTPHIPPMESDQAFSAWGTLTLRAGAKQSGQDVLGGLEGELATMMTATALKNLWTVASRVMRKLTPSGGQLQPTRVRADGGVDPSMMTVYLKNGSTIPIWNSREEARAHLLRYAHASEQSGYSGNTMLLYRGAFEIDEDGYPTDTIREDAIYQLSDGLWSIRPNIGIAARTPSSGMQFVRAVTWVDNGGEARSAQLPDDVVSAFSGDFDGDAVHLLAFYTDEKGVPYSSPTHWKGQLNANLALWEKELRSPEMAAAITHQHDFEWLAEGIPPVKRHPIHSLEAMQQARRDTSGNQSALEIVASSANTLAVAHVLGIGLMGDLGRRRFVNGKRAIVFQANAADVQGMTDETRRIVVNEVLDPVLGLLLDDVRADAIGLNGETAPLFISMVWGLAPLMTDVATARELTLNVLAYLRSPLIQGYAEALRSPEGRKAGNAYIKGLKKQTDKQELYALREINEGTLALKKTLWGNEGVSEFKDDAAFWKSREDIEAFWRGEIESLDIPERTLESDLLTAPGLVALQVVQDLAYKDRFVGQERLRNAVRAIDSWAARDLKFWRRMEALLSVAAVNDLDPNTPETMAWEISGHHAVGVLSNRAEEVRQFTRMVQIIKREGELDGFVMDKNADGGRLLPASIKAASEAFDRLNDSEVGGEVGLPHLILRQTLLRSEGKTSPWGKKGSLVQLLALSQTSQAVDRRRGEYARSMRIWMRNLSDSQLGDLVRISNQPWSERNANMIRKVVASLQGARQRMEDENGPSIPAGPPAVTSVEEILRRGSALSTGRNPDAGEMARGSASALAALSTLEQIEGVVLQEAGQHLHMMYIDRRNMVRARQAEVRRLNAMIYRLLGGAKGKGYAVISDNQGKYNVYDLDTPDEKQEMGYKLVAKGVTQEDGKKQEKKRKEELDRAYPLLGPGARHEREELAEQLSAALVGAVEQHYNPTTGVGHYVAGILNDETADQTLPPSQRKKVDGFTILFKGKRNMESFGQFRTRDEAEQALKDSGPEGGKVIPTYAVDLRDIQPLLLRLGKGNLNAGREAFNEALDLYKKSWALLTDLRTEMKGFFPEPERWIRTRNNYVWHTYAEDEHDQAINSGRNEYQIGPEFGRQWDRYYDAAHLGGMTPRYTSGITLSEAYWNRVLLNLCQRTMYVTGMSTIHEDGAPTMVPLLSVPDRGDKPALTTKVTDIVPWEVLRLNYLRTRAWLQYEAAALGKPFTDPGTAFDRADWRHALSELVTRNMEVFQASGYESVFENSVREGTITWLMRTPNKVAQRRWPKREYPAYRVMKLLLDNDELFDTQRMRKIVNGVEEYNRWTKMSRLSFSLFHPAALYESMAASIIGMKVGATLVAHDLLGAGAGSAQAHKMRMYNWPSTIDAIRHGLIMDVRDPEFDAATSSVDVGHKLIKSMHRIEAWADKVGTPWSRAIGFGMENWRHFYEAQSSWLWHKVFPTYKLLAYEASLDYVLASYRRQEKEYDIDEVKRNVARYTNHAFGGLNWDEMLLMTPKMRRVFHLLLMAPDWTLASLRVAGAHALMPGGVAITAEEKYLMATQYWPMMVMVVQFGVPQVLQSVFRGLASLLPWGEDDEDGHWLIASNEPGREGAFGFGAGGYIDVTPLAAKLGWSGKDTGERRVYIRWAKQSNEVWEGWLFHAERSLRSKMAPAIGYAMDIFVGSDSLGRPLPHKESGIPGWFWAEGSFWNSKLWWAIRNGAPLSISGFFQDRPVSFISSAAMGTSKYAAEKAVGEALIEYANDATWATIEQQGIGRRNLEALVGEYLEAARANGYEPQKVFDSGRGHALSHFYAAMFDALNKGHMDDASRIGAQIVALNGTQSGLEESLTARYASRTLEIPEDVREIVPGILEGYGRPDKKPRRKGQ